MRLGYCLWLVTTNVIIVAAIECSTGYKSHNSVVSNQETSWQNLVRSTQSVYVPPGGSGCFVRVLCFRQPGRGFCARKQSTWHCTVVRGRFQRANVLIVGNAHPKSKSGWNRILRPPGTHPRHTDGYWRWFRLIWCLRTQFLSLLRIGANCHQLCAPIKLHTTIYDWHIDFSFKNIELRDNSCIFSNMMRIFEC